MESRVETANSLCMLGVRPYLMTGFLTDALRRHFADRDAIENPILRAGDPPYDSIWRADISTGIEIQPSTRWNPKLVEKRPAIIIRRNDVTTQRLGINNQVQGAYAMPEVAAQYTLQFMGSHTLFVIAGDGGAAEILSWEVSQLLVTFTPLIRERLTLMRFEVAQIGGAGLLKEAAQNYVVPVTVGYAFHDDWAVAQDAPPLKSIVSEVRTAR